MDYRDRANKLLSNNDDDDETKYDEDNDASLFPKNNNGTVTIVAPLNLPEGYTFDATVNGTTVN